MGGRQALSLGFVAGGVALAVGGFPLVAVAAALLWDGLPLLLIAAGALALVVAVVPVSRLLLAAALVLVGLAVHAARTYEIDSAELLRFGAAFLAVALGVVLSIDRGRSRDADPVRQLRLSRRRRWAVLSSRTFRVATAPARVRLAIVLGRGTLVIDHSTTPQRGVIEVFVSLWGGRAVITVPPRWSVVGGRVDATVLVDFRGSLDSTSVFADPSDVAEETELLQMRAARDDLAVLVVHVLGAAGCVEITRSRP